MNKTRVAFYFLGPFVGISAATVWQGGNVTLAIALIIAWLVTCTLFFYEAHSKNLLK